MVWHTPTSCARVPKGTKWRYFVNSKGVDFPFFYPFHISFVVYTAAERACQQPQKWTSLDWAAKFLDLLGRKVYSLVALQCLIVNFQAKYDFNNYTQLAEFQDKLPADQQQQFQALVDEGCLVTKMGLQAAVDMANTTSCSIAMGIIMHQNSWLQSSGFPKEVQIMIEDLPFDEDKLSSKTDSPFLRFRKGWDMCIWILRKFAVTKDRIFIREIYPHA